MKPYGKFRHGTPIQLRFKDVDAMGHVNNANHFSYMELARVHYFHDVIAKDNDWSQNGFILAKMVIDYVRPIVITDELITYTRCIRIGNKSFDLEYAIVCDANDPELVATGLSVIVCFDYSRKESMVIPDEWAEKMRAYDKVQ